MKIEATAHRDISELQLYIKYVQDSDLSTRWHKTPAETDKLYGLTDVSWVFFIFIFLTFLLMSRSIKLMLKLREFTLSILLSSLMRHFSSYQNPYV